MIGISYWDKEAGKKLATDIEEVFNSPGGKERYWDQVPFVYKKENYTVEVRECKSTDIVEIDTYNELKKIDKLYAGK
jgi:CTP:phosphocholine cytidylyltransferase-like protein